MITFSPKTKKLYSLTDRIIDFYNNWASSPPGFLQLILIFRFIVLIITTINFGYIFSETKLPIWKGFTSSVIFLYFGFTVYLVAIAVIRKDTFEGRRIQKLQIYVDTFVISYFYWMSAHISHTPHSYVYLFYFLPLLVTARFLAFRTLVPVTLYILFASLMTWEMEIPSKDMQSAQFWFANLLPQFGFLSILMFFYLIYYRRRKMGEHIQSAALQLENQMGRLWQGWFTVDRDLRIVEFDTAIQQRHSFSGEHLTCASVLCQNAIGPATACSACPVQRTFTQGIFIQEAEIEFMDRNGAKYMAEVTVQPVLNAKHEVVKASVWVKDVDERKTYQQKLHMLMEDLERVIDQNRQEDQARLQSLARNLETISQASESALASDLFRGADEIIRATVILLDGRVAMLYQVQVDEETGRDRLVLHNHYGLEQSDVEQISILDLDSNSQVVRAFRSGEDQFVEDLLRSGLIKYEKVSRSQDLCSMACFPLKIQGNVIGTFTLFRSRPQGFTDGDRKLGRSLSNIMATLVANQRQAARDQLESQRRLQELEILGDLSRKLVTIDDLSSLAQLIADTVCQELHAETAAVFVEQDQLLRRVAISGIESEWYEDEAYFIGEGITGMVALPEAGQSFGRRIIENDVENSDMVVSGNLVAYGHKLASGRVCHLLGVPLNGLEGTFGVLRVVNKLDSQGRLSPHGFTNQEAELMTTIACIVAVAMENARLFEKEKEKHLLEQALRQSTRALTSTLDEENILDTILEHLGKVVSYDTASLFLWEGEWLIPKAMAGFTPEERQSLQTIKLDPHRNPPFIRMQQDQQTILIDDLQRDKLLEPIVGTSRIRSWIGAPLIIRDQIMGWLSVDSWEPGQFTAKDVEVAQDFAQQAAIAIDNAHQYKLGREQVASLLKLDQYLVDITMVKKTNPVLDAIARAASELMDCEMAGIAIYDKDKKEIHALPGVGTVGVPLEYVQNFTFPLEHRGGRVVQDKRVYQTNDASMDPESIFGHRLIDSIGAKGVIAAPLTIGDMILGVLYAASHSPKNWTDFQLAFFSIFSNHAAIAFRNAQLFDAKERRAQLLNLLHHLSIAGQLTNVPEVIYNILLTAVTAEYGLRFNRALLMLYDKENNTLKGFTGIGQLEHTEAYHVWETLDHGAHSFQTFIADVLTNGITRYTALHYKAKNLEIPIRIGSEDVFSRAFLTRNLQVVDPINEHVRIEENFQRIFNTSPFVVVPLLVNREVVGMLVADNKMTGNPINKLELELLESCASQAAAAVYRSNLHQQLRDRVAVLEHLQELARVFSELAEPREVLRLIAEATIDVLHADIVYLVPYRQETDELLVTEAVTAGAKTVYQHEVTFSTHGLTSLAKQEPGGLVIIEDLKSKKDLRSRFAEQEDVHSVAVCRLELRKQIVGMLYVNYRRHHMFAEMELDTLRMLAGQAAVAIHNAHLHKRNDELAAQRERNRLREDLHDVLNTYAFKVMEPAESIFEKESKKRRRDPALVEESEELWRFSRHTYQQLERILEDMRDPILVERGLQKAICLLIEQSRLPGVQLTMDGDVRPSADVELALYRICQEAISNIRKHARLPKEGENLCTVALELYPERSRLLVRDSGQGFSVEALTQRRTRMGLQAMENWARKVGARIEIHSTPGGGTTLEVVAPGPSI